ncbi:MAG TPA: WD40 repeat domain-containing protein [Pyrinomonadaceae bacterium]|nr:WD40 repeat domain-containing protein [Pyrinomonadaceae bacterium]
MSNGLSKDFCPYKGLQPYTEADRAFFFGRERDAEIIASNLYAAPLTVLYGESGVGKSSVLLAGVVPLLRQTPNVAVVVFRQWQDARFAQMLKSEIVKAVAEASGKEASVDASLPLDEFLIACNRVLRGPIFFLFDQFEEFFLYHAAAGGAEGFDAEWARSVNRQEVDANFLISLREDSLSRLDRFRGRMPQLMGNMLRLKHLDEAAGRTAIRKPLEKYNELLSDGEPSMEIEDALVETLLREIQAGRVTLGAGGGQATSTEKGGAEKGAERIETPFLQMVLTRLWDEERSAGSHVLRLETLNRLGGAERIIRTHLDKVMEKLSASERDVAAQLFRFLVTPSGSKIAHTTNDLISYAEMPSENVEPVLKLLGSPEVRILRPIAPPPGHQDGARYEIFHDVLAQAVLDWRTRYAQEQRRLAAERELAEERRRAESKLREAQQRARSLRWGATGLTVILLLTALLLALVLRQRGAILRAQVDSHSRELAAYSKDNSDYDPDLSLLLAIESARVSMTTEAIASLKRSLVAQQTRFVLRGHTAAVRAAVFSPDGKFVATSGWDKTARVWETATGKPVSVLSGHAGPVPYVAFSHDGQFIVTAGRDAKALVWTDWQTSAPRVVATITESAPLWSAAFSPDGRYIVTGGDKLLRVWEWRPPNGGPQKRRELPMKWDVYNAVFSTDGSPIAASGQQGALIWQWQTGASSSAPDLSPKYAAYRMAFSHDERYIGARCGDSTACIWEWKNAESLAEPVELSKSMLGIRGVTFSPDDRLVATGQEDGTVLVWNWQAERMEDRAKPQLLLGHVGDNSMIHALDFSPDGQLLVSASEDKTARIWTLRPLDPNQLDRLPPAELLKFAESRALRPFTPQERERYLHDTH